MKNPLSKKKRHLSERVKIKTGEVDSNTVGVVSNTVMIALRCLKNMQNFRITEKLVIEDYGNNLCPGPNIYRALSGKAMFALLGGTQIQRGRKIT